LNRCVLRPLSPLGRSLHRACFARNHVSNRGRWSLLLLLLACSMQREREREQPGESEHPAGKGRACQSLPRPRTRGFGACPLLERCNIGLVRQDHDGSGAGGRIAKKCRKARTPALRISLMQGAGAAGPGEEERLLDDATCAAAARPTSKVVARRRNGPVIPSIARLKPSPVLSPSVPWRGRVASLQAAAGMRVSGAWTICTVLARVPSA
jgi:hypothetical protein